MDRLPRVSDVDRLMVKIDQEEPKFWYQPFELITENGLVMTFDTHSNQGHIRILNEIVNELFQASSLAIRFWTAKGRPITTKISLRGFRQAWLSMANECGLSFRYYGG